MTEESDRQIEAAEKQFPSLVGKISNMKCTPTMSTPGGFFGWLQKPRQAVRYSGLKSAFVERGVAQNLEMGPSVWVKDLIKLCVDKATLKAAIAKAKKNRNWRDVENLAK